MDPMVVDVLVCQDGDQCSDKTLLAGAVGAEVTEIIDSQAAAVPFHYSVGHAGYNSACLSHDSEVIHSSRCTLMAERLSGGFGVWFSQNSFLAGLTPQ